MKIGVIGAGSWGTALADLLANNANDVTLWGANEEKIQKIKKDRENKEYLPKIKLNKNLKYTHTDEDLKDCEMLVLAVPSKTIRQICERFFAIAEHKIIVNVAKGLEQDSLKRLSEVIKEALPNSKIGTLSGPSHAEEVAKKMATACVASAYEMDTATAIQEVFMNDRFRVYINMDIIGVEIGGALKNLIALAAGATDGCGFGDNAKAALMTRGIAEIARLGTAMGASNKTFYGLTGIGDLIVTCTSNHSRNMQAGVLLGQGKNVDEVLQEIKMVVEGINVAKAAYDLSLKYDVNMPITKEIYQVIFNGKDIKKAVIDLMTRDKTYEA